MRLHLIAGLFTGCLALFAATSNVRAEPITFQADSGEQVEAERANFSVPENRNNPDSRMIELSYVRFASTSDTPGAPIIYLAGGPGGSGVATARGRRFPLFMALREIADVIAFDQRGTGGSNAIPACTSSQTLAIDEPGTRETMTRLYRAAAAECAAFWQEQGVDIKGYNTLESARDLDALRAHLGAEKVSLWGISYGTHLALAALKVMEPRLERIILASAEGLDQTVKLPLETDAYFGRVQAMIDADPEAKRLYPDVKALVRTVITRLQEEPALVDFSARGGGQVALGAFETQDLIGGAIADPQGLALLLPLLSAAEKGDYAPLTTIVHRFIRRNVAPFTMRGMPGLMDVSSGISQDRLALVNAQAETALLGDSLNYPMPHARGAFGDIDLGDAFRQAPQSDVPTLLLTGTLDGRTYPNEQRAAVKGLTNLSHVTIENAGHNLFMVSPQVSDVILGFMKEEFEAERTLRIDPPRLGAGQ